MDETAVENVRRFLKIVLSWVQDENETAKHLLDKCFADDVD